MQNGTIGPFPVTSGGMVGPMTNVAFTTLTEYLDLLEKEVDATHLLARQITQILCDLPERDPQPEATPGTPTVARRLLRLNDNICDLRQVLVHLNTRVAPPVSTPPIPGGHF